MSARLITNTIHEIIQFPGDWDRVEKYLATEIERVRATERERCASVVEPGEEPEHVAGNEDRHRVWNVRRQLAETLRTPSKDSSQ